MPDPLLTSKQRKQDRQSEKKTLNFRRETNPTSLSYDIFFPPYLFWALLCKQKMSDFFFQILPVVVLLKAALLLCKVIPNIYLVRHCCHIKGQTFHLLYSEYRLYINSLGANSLTVLQVRYFSLKFFKV